MSYFADHLAWQQRVNHEFKATIHHTDEENDSSNQSRFAQYPDMINYMMNTQKSHNKKQRKTMQRSEWGAFNTQRRTEKEVASNGPFNGSFYQSQRGQTSSSMGMKGILNSGNYGYVPRAGQLAMSQTSSKQRTQSAVGGVRRDYRNARHGRNDDVVSYTSQKSAQASQRMKSVASKQKSSVFGGKASFTGKQERFNEELDTRSTVSKQKNHNMMSQKNLYNFTKGRPSLKVCGTPNLNATRSQAGDRKSVFSAQSRFSQRDGESVRSSQGGLVLNHKRRILDVVNQLTPDELEKVSEMLRASEIIPATGDQDMGAARKSMDAIEFDVDVRMGDDACASDAEIEAADQVDELRQTAAANEEDKLTSVSRVHSTSSAGKSVVASLSKQLNEEKDARRRLEQELRALQTQTSEIAQKLNEKGQ